tara:strand:+ start:998 stop:1180 length:183 start_codon:yes stop_codon:yes gene_type:complete
MFKILSGLKKMYNVKSRSKKPDLETIPENNTLYSSKDVDKNEVLNTVFLSDHWSLSNKKT